MRVAPRGLRLAVIVGVSAIALAGCSGDDDGTDSGLPDAQVPEDAGPPDAGLPDAGLPDAGLPDAGRSCVGDARACASFGMLACSPVPGCEVSASPVCYTIPTDCVAHTGNPAVCAATYGCYYNVFLGCKPTYRLCTVPDGMECTDVAGCASGYVCTGEATACESLEPEVCPDNPGCFVYPP